MGKDGWGRDGGINGGVEGRRDEGIKTEMGRGGGERCTKEPGARRFRVGRCHGGKPGLVTLHARLICPWMAICQAGTQVSLELSYCLGGGVAYSSRQR